MNSKARRLGLLSATFYNSTGLDIDEHKAGAYATAEDVNQMNIYALKAYPEIFSATTFSDITLTSESGFLHNVKNTDVSLDKIPNVIFSKTGFTAIAGGNLAIIFKDKMNHDIAITLLGSTFSGRFTDMEKIVSVLELSYGTSN
jgi:D-alanyl-D-alanine carboxypeptidase